MPAVSIAEPRFKYKAGILDVDCGDGTRNPLKVTVDQLFKILYQVQDVYVASGVLELEYEVLDSTPATEDIIYQESNALYAVAPSPIPTDTTDLPRVVALLPDNMGGDYRFERGFFIRAASEAAPPPAGVEDYFPANSYAVQQLGSWDPNVFDHYFDALDDPAVMWKHGDDLPMFAGSSAATGHNWTAFDMWATGWEQFLGEIPHGFHCVTGAGSDTTFFGNGPYYVTLGISDVVVFVDNDGSGHPFSPGNDLYLGVGFDWTTNHSGVDTIVSARAESMNVPQLLSARVVFELPGEEDSVDSVSFPIYVEAGDFTYSGGGGNESIQSVTELGASDFVIKAFRKWDYT